MPINSIGRERESLMFTGEVYKRSVRRYLESMGYSETTDSYVEGHLPDMIFYNKDIEPGREFWIEAKDKKVGLTQKDFSKELLAMLEAWLYLNPNQRFKLKVFVQGVTKRTKWDLLFQSPIDKEYLSEWLEKVKTNIDDETYQNILKKPNKEIIDFFQEVEINIGPGYRLEIAAEEKMKTSALSPSRKAQSLLAESERRNILVENKTAILMNLMEFEPPKHYSKISLKTNNIEDIWAEFKESAVPPFAFDGGNIYTFAPVDSFKSMSKIIKRTYENLSVQELLEENPQQLIRILNLHIEKIARCKGLRKFGNVLFCIPRYDDSGSVIERLEKSITGKDKKVTRPMHETVESDDGTSSEKLNFVYHWAVILEVRFIWDKLFVQISPIRHFTTDGKIPLASDGKKRLERKYRNPMYNRSPVFRSWTIFWKYFIFDKPFSYDEYNTWFSNFEFHELLELTVIGSPESINKNQMVLSEFEGDEDDD